MELIILAVVAGLSFASYALWRQARSGDGPRALDQPKQPALTDGERTIHTIQPGDVVTHLGTDWLVEGVLSLDDDGRWSRLYRLADGARVRWMAARPGDDHPLVLDEAPDLAIEANGPESIAWRGLPFRLAARESVVAAPLGSVGEGRAPGRAQLWQYVGGGASRILALAWPARVEAFAGERVEPHFVEILPGKPST